MRIRGVRRLDLNTASLGSLIDPGAEGVVGNGQVATGLKQISKKKKGSAFVANAGTEAAINRLAISLSLDRKRIFRKAV